MVEGPPVCVFCLPWFSISKSEDAAARDDFPVETIERLFELGGEPMPIASIRSPFGYRLIDAPD